MLKKINLQNLKTSITNVFDLFICFNSFEKRCYSIANCLPKDNIKSTLILTNKIPLENAESNLRELIKIFPNRSEVLQLDLSKPITSADNIISYLEKHKKEGSLKHILIDITTFTHEILLILLAILNNQYKDVKISCAYNNASEYSTDREQLDLKWLSKGVGDIRTVLGYSGNYKLSQDNYLIVIAGYEYERAAKIIDTISPDYLSIGFNNENNATTDKNRSANSSYVKLLKNISAYYEQRSDFIVPCDNPFEAYKAICNKLDSIDKGVNIIIVPMNNKISTVGIALAALERPNIQVCYAPALIYNTAHYSQPGDWCYIFPIDFSDED